MTIRSYLALVAIALATGAPLRAQVPQYDHVVVVIFENHSYSEIIGKRDWTRVRIVAQWS